MMRKKWVIVLCIMIWMMIFWSVSYAVENGTNVTQFLSEMKEFESDWMPELTSDNVLETITSGNIFQDNTILEKILTFLLRELKENIKIFFNIFAVCIIGGILKNMQSSYGEGVSEIAFYVCFLLIVILAMNSYANMITVCKETMTKLCNFMNLLIPLILTLLVANGSIMTVGMLQPVLLLMISFINLLMTKVIFPILLLSTAIGVVSNVTETIDISKLSKFLQKLTTWSLEFVLIIFVGVLSIEGTLSANVDGLSAKTTKAIVSTVIPVVGKALSDATDSVLGAASITKNAIGVLGVFVILGISLGPLLKVFVLMLTYQLASAITEPIADKRIVKCITSIGDTMKIAFATLATTSVLFILSITLMIKMGNFTLMYR